MPRGQPARLCALLFAEAVFVNDLYGLLVEAVCLLMYVQ